MPGMALAMSVRGGAKRPKTAQAADMADDSETTASSALVCVSQPAAAPVHHRIVRPDAFFVAQLIATAAMTPQTRMLRRAGPEALAGYRTAAGMPTAANGSRLSRVA